MSATGAPQLDRFAVPDPAGHFGPFGGIFVPETLMAALEELESVYKSARSDPAFQAELRRHLAEFAGRPTPLYFAERLTPPLRRGEDLPEARGPAPHGRPQDQQRDRPGAPRAADGQEADHRRDGRGPARRGDGGGVRQVRPRMRRLHGGRRHGAPGAECLPDAAHGRGGARRRGRPEDAQGGHQRGDARLGDQRAHDPLHPRHGLRRAPLPEDGARFSPRDRQSRPGSRSSPARAGCPTSWSRASAAAATRSGSSSNSSRTRRCG